MSHFKERSSRNCLNCNAQVHGRYCHVCGQENIETFESAGHLITHFFKDITHFDGKFFSTLRYILFKPGFVSREYFIGRRASYINPIRLYIFTSALFFLIFFSVMKPEQEMISSTVNGKDVQEIAAMDSATFARFTAGLSADSTPMTRPEFAMYVDTMRKTSGIHFTSSRYKSRAQYDSLLTAGVKKHGWIERQLIYKEIDLQEKYKGDQQKILTSFINTLTHSFPQMLFISLPVFAFLLKLLYHRRKHFYYSAHAIFGIHFYVFVFIILFMMIAIVKVNDWVDWRLLDFVNIFLFFLLLCYEYKAMRVYYQQGRGKTILKFILLNIAHYIVILFLFVFFVFFSLYKL